MGEHFRLQKGLSCLGILAVLGPLFAARAVQWMMGLSGQAFPAFMRLTVFLAVLLSPLAIAGWSAFYRPRLVLGSDALQMFIGRRVSEELPRWEIEEIQVRSYALVRIAVAKMGSGADHLLVPPFDLRLPLLHDREFDRRVSRLEEWRRSAGERTS